jgi:hypothetical protein
VSVLHEDEDKGALEALLNETYDNYGAINSDLQKLMKNFERCQLVLAKKQKIKIICYVDQINEIYNFTTKDLLEYNLSWLRMLTEQTILITSGSSRNEFQFEKTLKSGITIKPQIKLTIDDLKILIGRKYNIGFPLTKAEFEYCYYLTNGIFLEVNKMFGFAKTSFTDMLKQYKKDYDTRYQNNSHLKWLEKNQRV